MLILDRSSRNRTETASLGQINDKTDVGGFFISAIAALVQANSSLLVIPEAKLLASIVGITTGLCTESELLSFSEALSFTPETVTTTAVALTDKTRMVRSPINLDFTP